jgi:ATPase components of various ABC-type transport systems, contain duplicated ATPase
MLLSIKNLSISFQNSPNFVVEKLCFQLESGECLGIVGESGSGKSLTALSLLGLLPNHAKLEGESHFKLNEIEIDLFRLSSSQQREIRGRQIGIIFQEPMTALNPSMKCGKQVDEMMVEHLNLNKKVAKEKTLELFREVQLDNPEKAYQSYPHQLSGGQRQRVMIAMAVSCSPSLLIADEPTTALDVTVQKAILNLIKRLQKSRNIAVIFISHDLGVISEIADKIMVMHKGKMVETGDTHQIISNPNAEYTKGLLACKPSITTTSARLPFLTEDGSLILPGKEKAHYQKENPANNPIITVKNLCVTYEVKQPLFSPNTNYHALRNIDLAIYKGETLGLVGESGSGKTTIGRAITMLVKTRQGEITYHGKNVTSLRGIDYRMFRKNIQLVFQDPFSSLNPKHTVRDILAEPLRLIGNNRGELNNKIFQLLNDVNLPKSSANKYPHEFSGGQRQRISLARALALNPELIICDESVSALDVSVQAAILNLLNQLKEEKGLTYLFISHDLSVVKYMSDRIVVLQHGEVKEVGESAEIYQHPQSPYTQMLIASIPGIQNSL